MGHLAVHDVDPPDQGGLNAAGFGEAGIGEELNVAIGDVGQGLGGSAGIGARHVRHAIVRCAFVHEDRVVMGGGAGGFSAAALVNGDVHKDAARPHAAEHFAAD